MDTTKLIEFAGLWPAKSGKAGVYSGTMQRDIAAKVCDALGLPGSPRVLVFIDAKQDGNKPILRVLIAPDDRAPPPQGSDDIL